MATLCVPHIPFHPEGSSPMPLLAAFPPPNSQVSQCLEGTPRTRGLGEGSAVNSLSVDLSSSRGFPQLQEGVVPQDGANHFADVGDPRSHYDIHKVLRDSLFGQVLLGTHRASKKTVAIKLSYLPLVVKGRTLNGTKVLEDPRTEARIMKKVHDHPFVLTLVGSHLDNVDSETQIHWLVTEFAEHGEFFDFVCKKGYLQDELARLYFQQMALALKHLHSRHVCHLDFSLENLLMDENHNIRLADLGVARETPTDGSLMPGFRQEKPGKLRYMSPEVLTGQDFDGKASDVFALGVTLASMLTGTALFKYAHEKDEKFNLIAKGRLKELLVLLGLKDRVSESALDLLNGMLRVDFRKRPTIHDVLRHPWVLPH